ncbi:uncharacterized protein LOC110250051 [Exaiptasia diaphana]|uniref:Uncharacterized protein n=1 Tax=Exaiptasia diaphana TaxID=2652724 RepID=A0A913XYM7_EXADI|nr:uncharacterized protein LOC110250051 [Exaiptasia diaphana]
MSIIHEVFLVHLVANMLALTCGLNSTIKQDLPTESPETSATEPSVSMSRKIRDWFLNGLAWKTATVVAGGLLLLTLLVLTLYRIRKRRISKNQTLQVLQEPTVEICVPRDNTFMGSHSTGVVHKADIQKCTSPTEKPRVKSKMLRSFKEDNPNIQQPRGCKNDPGNGIVKSTRNDQRTPSHLNNTNSIFCNLQHDIKCKEVIYQNQEHIQCGSRLHSSAVTEKQPIYQNSHHALKRINWNKQGVKEEVIYENT